MTCVSMGNPHAITYSVDGKPIKVSADTLVNGDIGDMHLSGVFML